MLFHDRAELVDGNKTIESPDRVIHYYDIKIIEQYQGLGYEEMADRVVTIMQNPQLKMNTDLIVDGTGVGEAAVELIRKRGLYPIPIIFTGGNSPKENYAEFGSIFNSSKSFGNFGVQTLKSISVPKKDLVDAGKVMIQQGRLGIDHSRWSEECKKQISKFKGKVNERTKNVKYEAETEQDHDDLVVCFLLGCWWIFNRKEKGIPEQTSSQNDTTGWEPMDYC